MQIQVLSIYFLNYFGQQFIVAPSSFIHLYVILHLFLKMIYAGKLQIIVDTRTHPNLFWSIYPILFLLKKPCRLIVMAFNDRQDVFYVIVNLYPSNLENYSEICNAPKIKRISNTKIEWVYRI